MPVNKSDFFGISLEHRVILKSTEMESFRSLQQVEGAVFRNH